jgi:hypothetical protein
MQLKLTPRITVAMVVCVIVLWLAIPAFVAAFYPRVAGSTIPTDFDSVSALFAGLAFAGLILAVLLQTDQLRQQTEQLKLQREEIALQRADLALQREEMKLQRDEMKRASDAQEKTEEALRKRLEFEQILQAKRMTLGLYEEWQHPDMIAARHEIEKYLFTPNFMTGVTLTGFAKDNRSEFRLFVRVLRYLEKVTLLSRLGEIDAALLAKLLGSDITWVYQNFVTRFSPEKEDRADLKRLVGTVRESELSKWAG